MNLVNIEFKHKEKIEAIRLNAGVSTNAMSFYSCYIWKEIFGHKLYISNDMYAVTYKLKGENAWYFPVGREQAKKAFLDELICTDNLSLHKFNDDDKQFLEKYYPDRFLITECPEDSEYIYNINDVCIMTGSKYSKLRQKYKPLIKKYNFSIEQLRKENIHKSVAVIEEWSADKTAKGLANTVGDEIDLHVLEKYDLLDLEGILVKIGNEAYAIAAGYKLTEDTFDLAICKARSSIKYMGYAAFVEMMKYLADRYTYMNLEEDMGITGLHIMKENMGPIKRNRLWKAVIKNEVRK